MTKTSSFFIAIAALLAVSLILPECYGGSRAG
jgi:hypothetical protein